jgi:hypothetical protein
MLSLNLSPFNTRFRSAPFFENGDAVVEANAEYFILREIIDRDHTLSRLVRLVVPRGKALIYIINR